jgi:glutamate decarboxylase
MLDADTSGCIDLKQLRETLGQCKSRGDCAVAVVGIAGATETGGVDPLRAMAEMCASFGVHFHVDAAWGGPVLFSKKYLKKLDGIDCADTVTIDGHKQLYLPMGLGMVMMQDPQLAKSIEKTANYIIRADSPDLGRRTLEGSRPAMAIFLHGALHIIGSRGYEYLIEHGIENCYHLAERVRERSDFELLCEPVLNIIVFRYMPAGLVAKCERGALVAEDNEEINRVNRLIQDVQKAGGWGFVSRTTLGNTKYGTATAIVCLRAVLANPLTTTTDIDAVLNEIAELGRRV